MWRERVPQDQPVHFLKVDVEGFEREVLLGGDWSVNRPWIVVVEATAPLSTELRHAAWENILVEAGYKFVYFDGLNRFYVAREHADLEAGFSAPPNVFDDYVPAALIERDGIIATSETRRRPGAGSLKSFAGSAILQGHNWPSAMPGRTIPQPRSLQSSGCGAKLRN